MVHSCRAAATYGTWQQGNPSLRHGGPYQHATHVGNAWSSSNAEPIPWPPPALPPPGLSAAPRGAPPACGSLLATPPAAAACEPAPPAQPPAAHPAPLLPCPAARLPPPLLPRARQPPPQPLVPPRPQPPAAGPPAPGRAVLLLLPPLPGLPPAAAAGLPPQPAAPAAVPRAAQPGPVPPQSWPPAQPAAAACAPARPQALPAAPPTAGRAPPPAPPAPAATGRHKRAGLVIGVARFVRGAATCHLHGTLGKGLQGRGPDCPSVEGAYKPHDSVPTNNRTACITCSSSTLRAASACSCCTGVTKGADGMARRWGLSGGVPGTVWSRFLW